MAATHEVNYLSLYKDSPRKSFQDAESASLLDAANGRQESLSRSAKNQWSSRIYLIIITTILVVCFSVSLVIIRSINGQGEPHLHALRSPYTPAENAVKYIIVKSADGYDEDMRGFPSEAHDNAWINLVSPALSRAFYDEMILGNEDPEHSVAVADGMGGYMFSLGVYHELHCLRRLKLYLHKEHYYPKLAHGSKEDTYELNHLNHCIEAIRLSLMCAGNTAMYTFQWPKSNENVRKPKTKTSSERKCVDWDEIERWARNRSIGMNPRLHRPVVDERIPRE